MNAYCLWTYLPYVYFKIILFPTFNWVLDLGTNLSLNNFHRGLLKAMVQKTDPASPERLMMRTTKAHQVLAEVLFGSSSMTKKGGWEKFHVPKGWVKQKKCHGNCTLITVVLTPFYSCRIKRCPKAQSFNGNFQEDGRNIGNSFACCLFEVCR